FPRSGFAAWSRHYGHQSPIETRKSRASGRGLRPQQGSAKMKRPLTITLGALALMIGFPSARALGQYNPYRPAGTLPPAYSPYLNLLRGGNSFATNYYGLVRPEIGFRNQILGLQQQTALNSYELQTGQTGQLQTGHPVQFLNYSHYFGNLGSR